MKNSEKLVGYSFSPGKIIISGEHSVVYGYPAIVAATEFGVFAKVLKRRDTKVKISKKVQEYIQQIITNFEKHYSVKFDQKKYLLDVEFEIPIQSGMGSSAACASAVIQALAKHFSISIDLEELYLLVFESEKFIHGTPSGIDPFAVVYGGVHEFRKDTKTGKISKEKIVLSQNYRFVAIQSGKATESTGEMVLLVKENLQKNKKKVSQILEKMGKVSEKIKNQLVNATFDGKLFLQNNDYLEELGVVGIIAKNMLAELEKNKIFAKVTGAGGIKKGSGFLLAFSDDVNEIVRICKQNTWEYHIITVQ